MQCSVKKLVSGVYAQQGGTAGQNPTSTKGAVVKGKAPVNKNLLTVKLPKEQEATLKNAQQAYDRAITLLKTNAGTQKNVEDAEAALRTAQARLNSSQTRLARRNHTKF